MIFRIALFLCPLAAIYAISSFTSTHIEQTTAISAVEQHSINVFTELAPSDADSLVILRPKQMLEFGPFHSEDALAHWDSTLPFDPNEVDLILCAANQKKITDTLNKTTRQAFDRIAAELGGEKVDPTPIVPLAESLNGTFSCLIRFNKPASWDQMLGLMELYNVPGSSAVSDWQGRELIGDEKTINTVRLDEQTFLICSRQKLEASTKQSPQVSKSLIGSMISSLLITAATVLWPGN